MALKVTLFFNQYNNGWTETYYATGNDPYSYIQSLPIVQLANNALFFRANFTYLYAIRASLVGTQRLNYSKVFGTYYQSPTPLGNEVMDYPSIDVLVKIQTPQSVKRFFWLRGLPETSTEIIEGVPVISADARLYISQYMSFLTNQCQAQIQYFQRPPQGGLFWTPVVSIAPVGGQNQPFSQITLANGFGFTASYLQRIVFQGRQRDLLPGFPDRTYVSGFVAGPPPVITIPYLYRGVGPIEFPTKMKCVVQVPQYVGFVLADIERVTSHKTGRAFGVSRGRVPLTVRAQ